MQTEMQGPRKLQIKQADLTLDCFKCCGCAERIKMSYSDNIVIRP